MQKSLSVFTIFRPSRMIAAIVRLCAARCAAQDQSAPPLRNDSTTNAAAPGDMNSPTPIDNLLNAAKSGDIKTLKLLVANGADVNGIGPRGEDALVVAIGQRNHTCVEWLLSHGANPNLEVCGGRSAVSVAAGLSDDSKSLGMVLATEETQISYIARVSFAMAR